ncbi:MAG: DNA replication and repair protein RecF, partial [Nonlabens sp.]
FAKSYFNPIATQNITHGQEFFVISGTFEKNDRDEKIVVSSKRGAKRIVKRNGKIYEKIADHIGLLPLVIISPADRDLITEGSDTRRKFLDGVISLEDPVYLNRLMTYNRLVQQRNALLKYFNANSTFDSTALSVYDQQLVDHGTFIYLRRREVLEYFIPIFNKYYQQIAQTSEQVNINYKSDLMVSDFALGLSKSQQKDLQLQYTSMGIHKDDLNFQLDGFPIKKYGSQGQQKSFLTALKLAQFEFIKEKSKTVPILLLDDIFDKLDESRVAQLVNMVNQEQFGQIFISDTHPERTEEVIKRTNQSYKIFKL